MPCLASFHYQELNTFAILSFTKHLKAGKQEPSEKAHLKPSYRGNWMLWEDSEPKLGITEELLDFLGPCNYLLCDLSLVDVPSCVKYT